MSKVRDRFDAGKQAQHDAHKRELYVRWGTQKECERYQIESALASADRHVPGTFAHALVEAYNLERHQERQRSA